MCTSAFTFFWGEESLLIYTTALNCPLREEKIEKKKKNLKKKKTNLKYFSILCNFINNILVNIF